MITESNVNDFQGLGIKNNNVDYDTKLSVRKHLFVIQIYKQ